MKKILMTAGLLISIASSYAQADFLSEFIPKADPIEEISIRCEQHGGVMLISEKNKDIRQGESINDTIGLKLDVTEFKILNADKHLISFKVNLYGEEMTGETSIITNPDGSEQLVINSNILDDAMKCEVVK